MYIDQPHNMLKASIYTVAKIILMCSLNEKNKIREFLREKFSNLS